MQQQQQQHDASTVGASEKSSFMTNMVSITSLLKIKKNIDGRKSRYIQSASLLVQLFNHNATSAAAAAAAAAAWWRCSRYR